MGNLFKSKLLNIFALIYLISMISAFPSSIDGNNDCSNYCQNDGICVIINNDRQCYCLPEWEGNICQNPREYRTIQIDRSQQMLMSSARNHPCSLIPPKFCNGGLCQFSNNSFSCACPYDRAGSRCERESPCNGFCMNGGTCNYDSTTGEVKCQCPPLYTGMRCDAPLTTTADPTATTTTTTTISTTPNVVCAALQPFCNGGTCVFENNQAKCQCPSGKAGEYCEIDTGVTSGPGTANPGTGNPATNNPATNNPATGNPATGNPSSGTDNACASNPCLNNRPCYNNGNTFYCFCGNSYSGSRCETSRG